MTFRAQARDYQHREWQSAAEFRAGTAGTLNLATAVPVSGSYHVADAAGLLWSLRPEFTSSSSAQFYMSAAGFSVTVQVLVGDRVDAAVTLRRLWLARSSIQTVSQAGFASTLFTPANPKPGAPVIVAIGGSEGGEDTFLAGALATSGYPTLALGYFDEPGLPQCLCNIPLEYFARAAAWLKAQPVARGRRVILFGVSRGGEAALLIASYEPNLFSAVIASSPSASVNGPFPGNTRSVAGDAAWTWQGQPLSPRTLIPVGGIRVPLLMGDGGQDAVWDSAQSVALVMQELQAARDAAPHINLYYPYAGHAFLGTPPYVPYSGFGALGNAMGGSLTANAQADERSWTQMIEFINDPGRA